MRFFKGICLQPRRRKQLAMLALAMLAAGCQFVPKPSTQAPAAEDLIAGQPGVARAPNPYLADRPEVPSSARQHFESAQRALQQQQWDSAETDLLWITENYPAFSGPYLNLALLYQQSGRADQVEPAFRQAIAANANNIDAYNAFGVFLRKAGRFAEAEQVYLEALRRWPDSPGTHINLGILYDLYMGKLELALQHYRHYQGLLEEPDRRVEGWIVDTERRLQQSAAGGAS